MKLKIWLGVVISGFFIWLTFREIDYGALWMAMKRADYLYLLPTVILTIILFYFRSLRWGNILEPIKKIGIYSLFSATSIGYMANNILPARIGEFARAYAIGKEEEISVSASFATIVIERILDLLAVFILLFVVLNIISFPAENIEFEQLMRKGGTIAILVFICMIAFLYFFQKNTDFFKKIVFSIVKPYSKKVAIKLLKLMNSFASGFSVLQKGSHIIRIIIYSVVIWFLSAIPIHWILLSFGHELPLSISFFILVLIGFAVSVPSAPGYVGTFHFACSKGLELFNIPGEEALSVAIVLHAVNFFPITIIGAFFLWKDNISLKEAEELEEKGEEAI